MAVLTLTPNPNSDPNDVMKGEGDTLKKNLAPF